MNLQALETSGMTVRHFPAEDGTGGSAANSTDTWPSPCSFNNLVSQRLFRQAAIPFDERILPKQRADARAAEIVPAIIALKDSSVTSRGPSPRDWMRKAFPPRAAQILGDPLRWRACLAGLPSTNGAS